MKKLSKVMIMIFRKNPEIEFLVLKTARRHPIWQGVTGGVEEYDHSLKDAAARELKEELGLETKVEAILGPLYEFEFVTNRNGYEGTVAHESCFAVEVPPTFSVKLSEEHSEFRWLPYEKAQAVLTYESSQTVIEKVVQMLHIL